MTAIANVTREEIEGWMPWHRIHINIQMSVVIDPVLARRLPLDDVRERGRDSFGLACFDDERNFIEYCVCTTIWPVVRNESAVTNRQTYITLDNSIREPSRCVRDTVGGVETDKIRLSDSGEGSAEGYLEHELGHALGCRHTRAPASMMYVGGRGGNYQGCWLGISDVWCIIYQLYLQYRGDQFLSSDFVRNGASGGSNRLDPQMRDVWRPAPNNYTPHMTEVITNNRRMTRRFIRPQSSYDFRASVINDRHISLARSIPNGRPRPVMMRAPLGVQNSLS